MTRASILHLSDINTLNLAAIQKLFLSIQASGHSVHAILISGLGTDGTKEQLQKLPWVVEQLAHLFKLTLKEVLVVPGLHDLEYGYGFFSEHFSRGLFDQDFDFDRGHVLNITPSFQLMTLNTVALNFQSGPYVDTVEKTFSHARRNNPRSRVRGILHYHPLASFEIKEAERLMKTQAQEGFFHLAFAGKFQSVKTTPYREFCVPRGQALLITHRDNGAFYYRCFQYMSVSNSMKWVMVLQEIFLLKQF